MKRTALSLALTLFARVALAQEDEFSKPHIQIYKRVAPTVVAVSGGGQSGSGVLIDKSGIVLTSPTACGASSDTVRVRRKGHLDTSARVLGRLNEKELVVLQIEDEGPFPYLELGDSDTVQVGHVAYAFGDSFGSLLVDDQVHMSLGVVSGIYEIKAAKSKGAEYRGSVLEVSAAVNQNQDGGPIVDRQGRVVGLTTLNYEDSKFTGIAVPINALKKEIEAILREAGKVVEIAPSRGDVWIGMEVNETEDGLVVGRVYPRSPGAVGGLQPGDLLSRIHGKKVLTTKTFGEILAALKAGDVLKIRVVRNGKDLELSISLTKKPIY